MSTHLSNEIVERFHAQTLVSGDKAVIRDHILGCESCRLRIADAQTQAVALRAISEHFLPGEDEEPYHLDYQTIEAFVDDRLDPIDRSSAKLHLEDCAECIAEVEDLRESLATIKAVSRRRQGSESVTVAARSPATRFWVPLRIAAVITLVAFATVALIVFYKWRTTSVQTTAGSQPTPLASPQAPGVAPSPANSPQLVENPPLKEPVEKQQGVVVALKDGTNEITLNRDGTVAGLPALPSESREAVKEALSGEPIARPEVLDDVASAQVSERASSGNEERIRVTYPTNRVILENQPTLRWNPSKTAEAYRVEIADETFHQIAKSEDLPAASRNWKPPTQLKRGAIYTWTIRAMNKAGEPSTLTSQGKFKILGDDKLRELNQLKARQSHLALGLFYAREGMIADAEREFRILAKDNPDSTLAKRLLAGVKSWQKP